MEKSFLQLKRERLIHVEFIINENFNLNNSQQVIEIMPELKWDIFYDKDYENRAVIKLNIKIFDKEDFNSPFYMLIIMEGIFEWQNKNKEEIIPLLNINAPALLISYARSIISQLTVFGGFPPLILPLINFTRQEKI